MDILGLIFVVATYFTLILWGCWLIWQISKDGKKKKNKGVFISKAGRSIIQEEQIELLRSPGSRWTTRLGLAISLSDDLIVTRLHPGVAERDGRLKIGDRIIQVTTPAGKDVNLIGMEKWMAVNIMKAGRRVKFLVRRLVTKEAPRDRVETYIKAADGVTVEIMSKGKRENKADLGKKVREQSEKQDDATIESDYTDLTSESNSDDTDLTSESDDSDVTPELNDTDLTSESNHNDLTPKSESDNVSSGLEGDSEVLKACEAEKEEAYEVCKEEGEDVTLDQPEDLQEIHHDSDSELSELWDIITCDE